MAACLDGRLYGCLFGWNVKVFHALEGVPLDEGLRFLHLSLMAHYYAVHL